jgi:hypothetical protein
VAGNVENDGHWRVIVDCRFGIEDLLKIED